MARRNLAAASVSRPRSERLIPSAFKRAALSGPPPCANQKANTKPIKIMVRQTLACSKAQVNLQKRSLPNPWLSPHWGLEQEFQPKLHNPRVECTGDAAELRTRRES